METISQPTIDKPWTMGASQYQRLAGVKQPWIAEISPWQYANLSKRRKAAYDKQREEEWGASMAIKAEWRDRVIAAYTEGIIGKNDPELHPEARQAIGDHERLQEKQRVEAAKKQAHADNRITSIDQINVGDRVFDIMTNCYGTVTKKFKVGVRFEPENKPGGYQMGPMTVPAGRLQWKQYNDVTVG